MGCLGLVELSRHSRVANASSLTRPGFSLLVETRFLPRCQYSCVTQGLNYDVCSSLTFVSEQGNFRKCLPQQRQACSASSHSDVAPDSSSIFRDLWPTFRQRPGARLAAFAHDPRDPLCFPGDALNREADRAETIIPMQLLSLDACCCDIYLLVHVSVHFSRHLIFAPALSGSV
jgi:hypothetical protein